MYIHELNSFKELIEIVVGDQPMQPPAQIVEKDYWLTHVIWGLKEQGFDFELKGGTSLSKGYNIIHRFSEDVDIKIAPPEKMEVKSGKNQDRPAHIQSRNNYFDWLVDNIKIPGVVDVQRDRGFDDEKGRNAGLRLYYNSCFSSIVGLKPGILLEVGFDTTAPNSERTISSWTHEKVRQSGVDVENTIADDIRCYWPEYTFVEKMQAISTKFRQQQLSGSLPANFIRHYYDLYQLLKQERVLRFLGSPEYQEHKKARFRKKDEMDIRKNEAFHLTDPKTRSLYEDEYNNKSALYYQHRPEFSLILDEISKHINLM